MKTKLVLASLLSTVAMLGTVGSASAATIYSPVNGVINSGGPGFGNLADTYNHNGLLTNFVSGVDDFDTYLALNPSHSFLFSGNEWFSNLGNRSTTVTYDLGSVLNIDRLALWNEDSVGIGNLNLSYSTDGNSFSSLASGLMPSDNPINTNYQAQVFSFAATNARYVRFDASGCPQSGTVTFCAIGEVAFSGSPLTTAVPEPSGILGTSVLALGAIGRKVLKNRKKQSISSEFK
jgi:hypothetical protein